MHTTKSLDLVVYLYVGFQMELVPAEEVIEEVVKNLDKFEDYGTAPELDDLFIYLGDPEGSINGGITLIEKYIFRHLPEFEMKGPLGQKHGKKHFCNALKAFVADPKDTQSICKLVSPLEHMFDFPEWLGDLYNECDWLGNSEAERSSLVWFARDTINQIETSIKD